MAYIIEPSLSRRFTAQVYDELDDAKDALSEVVQDRMDLMDQKDDLLMEISITFKPGPASKWINTEETDEG